MIKSLVSWFRGQSKGPAVERYVQTGQVGVVREIPPGERSATDDKLDRVELGLVCESCEREQYVRTQRKHAATPRDGFICSDCRSGVLPPGTTPEGFFEQQRKSLGIDK